MRLRVAIQMVLAVVAATCGAQTNTLEDAILSFPDAYRPDEAVRSANTLIAAGEERACGALISAAGLEDPRDNPALQQKILWLCRLLFIPKDPAKPIPGAYDGAVMPVYREDYAQWPTHPFIITNGIPVLLPRFVSERARLRLALDGPQPGGNYVKLCQHWGVFRSEPFPNPTLLATSNAVKQVLTSPDWQAMHWRDSMQLSLGAAPREWAETKIWEQVENMKKPIAGPVHPVRNLGLNRIKFP